MRDTYRSASKSVAEELLEGASVSVSSANESAGQPPYLGIGTILPLDSGAEMVQKAEVPHGTGYKCYAIDRSGKWTESHLYESKDGQGIRIAYGKGHLEPGELSMDPSSQLLTDRAGNVIPWTKTRAESPTPLELEDDFDKSGKRNLISIASSFFSSKERCDVAGFPPMVNSAASQSGGKCDQFSE